MATTIHDVLIIGAGPAGLAVAARLREPTPSALFTDAEHNRYQWIKKYSGRMNLRPRERDSQISKCSSTSRRNADRYQSSRILYQSIQSNQIPISSEIKESNNHGINIKVLDSNGSGWLSSWRNNFAALGISHLRSPMFFHPCPRDRDGLLAFARETGRCDDCLEIANCVGKSMSKHRRKRKMSKGQSIGSSNKAILEIDERDRKDYYTPSAEIFHDYCQDVVCGYALEGLVEQAQVVSIDFGVFGDADLQDDGDPGKKLFKVVTTGGMIKYARVAVLAIGAGGLPIMPRQLSAAERDGACHSTQLPKQMFLAEQLLRKIRARVPTAVMIIGGGLTGAQIASKCIESGVRRVFMVMRSGLKCKPPPQ